MKEIFNKSKSLSDSTIANILFDALYHDGGHHKQWYIEQALLKLGFDLNSLYENEEEMEKRDNAEFLSDFRGTWEKGIAP